MLIIADLPRLRQSLYLHEGHKLLPYTDTAGKVTIGVGHNLTDAGISPEVCDLLLTEDIATAVALVERLLPWVATLDEVRKRAFVELAFNLGTRLLGFHTALDAAQRGDWLACSGGFRASLWARQVGHRAVELEAMLLTGTDPVNGS